MIVQKLNIILITSPELSDFRKRLKSLETRVGALYHLDIIRESKTLPLPFSKTDRRCSQLSIVHGVTILWLSFHYVSSLRRTNTHPICCIYCKSFASFLKLRLNKDVIQC